MSQKTYLFILKTGIYLSMVVVLFVFKNLLFPFITSKQLSFNVIIEVLTIVWAAFIIKYPEWRPRKNFITFGLLAFFAILTVSSITGVDFNLSFWGDVERMLGVFHLLHFLFFYLIVITVFRDYKDWRILLIASLIISTIISLYGIGGDKAYSTIGNTAYVSGYLIFNIYFAFLLFFNDKEQNLKWLYLAPLPIILMEFVNADTTGAYVGLGFSVLVLMALYVILTKNKMVRKVSFATLILLCIFIGTGFYLKDTNLIRKNSILRVFYEISFQKNTFQTRLISWRAALKDFKTHPILGTGHGNYAIIFDKYFDPKFYNYTKQETYFDRAHNNLIDIMSTSGLLGLLSYLSIFGAVGFYLVAGYRDGRITQHEFILLSCLIIAYFVQNLAVFDSLVTYMMLMITLGYLHWMYHDREKGVIADVEERLRTTYNYFTKDRQLENKEIYTITAVGIFIFVVMFNYNIRPWQMLVGTIGGQIANAQGQTIDVVMADYEKALSYNSVLDRDSRTSFVRLLISNPNLLAKVSNDKAQAVLDYAVKISEQNLEYNQEDSLNQMLIAQVFSLAANYYRNNQDKYAYYQGRAMDAIDKSIAASPGRVPIYFQKAQIQAINGDKEGALGTLEYAAGLNPDYSDGWCQLARMQQYFGIKEESYANQDKCVDLGVSSIKASDYLKSLISHYNETGDNTRLLLLNEQMVKVTPNSKDAWINLAKLYSDVGEYQKAIDATEKAIAIDPSIKNYADNFINEMKAKLGQ